MDFKTTLMQSALMTREAAGELLSCNERTTPYGLALSEVQAMALVETRAAALRRTGRVEFGGGSLKKLILAFADSPYLNRANYDETLHDLVEIFYYYKNETLELASDDELITFMKSSFDGECQGSLALLADKALYRYARSLRFGNNDDEGEEEESEED